MAVEKTKTGTTTIAFKCKDGIIIAGDMRATMGNFISDTEVLKVHPIMDNLALTYAGVASDAQMYTKLIKAELMLKKLRTNKQVKVKEAANFITSLTYQGLRMQYSITAFNVAGYDESGYSIYTISPDGFIAEKKEWAVEGSGSIFLYSFFDQNYKATMSVKEGVELVKKAFETSFRHDSASGNGYNVYVIDEKGVRKVLTETLKWVPNS